MSGLEGSGHVAIGVDLRDLSTHPQLVARARRDLGSLQVLANLAAVLHRRPNLDDVTEDDLDLQHDVNLKAAFFLCRAAGAAMIEQGRGGRIITFTSQAWWTGGFGGAVAYAASKGGVVSMTRGLARIFGPHRITVNAVAPALVRTPMLMRDPAPDLYGFLEAQTALGYVAEPADIAGTVVFLVSSHARYITVATINVTGGFLALLSSGRAGRRRRGVFDPDRGWAARSWSVALVGGPAAGVSRRRAMAITPDE